MKGPAELPAPHVAVGGVSCEPRPGRVLRKSARQDCPPTLSLFSNELQSEPHSAFWFPGTPWSSRKRRGTRKDRPERQPRKSPPGVQVGLTQCHMAWPEGDEPWVWGPRPSGLHGGTVHRVATQRQNAAATCHCPQGPTALGLQASQLC